MQGASLPETEEVGSSSQSMSAPILPKEGPTAQQASLGHRNKYFLRANVSQTLELPPSRIPGLGEDGVNLFTRLAAHIVCSSITAERGNQRGSALIRFKTCKPGHYRASTLLLPSNVHYAVQNTGKCLFSGDRKNPHCCSAFISKSHVWHL